MALTAPARNDVASVVPCLRLDQAQGIRKNVGIRDREAPVPGNQEKTRTSTASGTSDGTSCGTIPPPLIIVVFIPGINQNSEP
jgi:hypothetical protein